MILEDQSGHILCNIMKQLTTHTNWCWSARSFSTVVSHGTVPRWQMQTFKKQLSNVILKIHAEIEIPYILKVMFANLGFFNFDT